MLTDKGFEALEEALAKVEVYGECTDEDIVKLKDMIWKEAPSWIMFY